MIHRDPGGDAPAYDRKSIAGVVLAGGRSRRMEGGDKSQMSLGARSMLETVIDRMRPQVGALAVSSNNDPAHIFQLDLPIVADGEFGSAGPLSGILAGMRWARQNVAPASWLATAATDTPFFPPHLVRDLMNASGQPTVVRLAGSLGKTHPVFGLWPIDLAPVLTRWLANGASRKVSDWVEHIPYVVVDFHEIAGVDPFFNVNTPQDLTKARSLALEAAF